MVTGYSKLNRILKNRSEIQLYVQKLPFKSKRYIYSTRYHINIFEAKSRLLTKRIIILQIIVLTFSNYFF